MSDMTDLKREFSASARYKGYDADDDPGYFVEWLTDEVLRLRAELARLQSCVPLEETIRRAGPGLQQYEPPV